MGVVLLAEDPKLKRRVALKLLSAAAVVDSERIRRFILEATTASALNHPNIITIYEINDDHETPFIAMEFVEGKTLGKLLKRQAFNLATTFDVAYQAGNALAAAHEAGVVHRDIKPDNIIIRPDGLVKVLDFGLAKLTERRDEMDSEADTMAHLPTGPGVVMGTAGYMSPEQARGKKVDARSDIFSFGAVLYEMISGQRPFGGENELDVIASILHKEPVPLSQIVVEIPHDLETMIRKALRKNRDERYQTVREMLADLTEIKRDLGLETTPSGRFESVASDRGRLHTTAGADERVLTTAQRSGLSTNTFSQMVVERIKLHPLLTAAAAMVIIGLFIVGGFGVNRLLAVLNAGEPFQKMRMAKVTSTGNIVPERIAVTPDGKYVAYVVEEEGMQGLWVKQVATSGAMQIVRSAKIKFSGLAFSHDSNYLSYVVVDQNGASAAYRVPILGGSARRMLSDLGDGVSYSANGERISFVRDETTLIVANSDGTAERVLAAAPDGARWLLASWSPDADKLAAAAYSSIDSKCHLFEVSIADGSVRPLASPAWLRISGLAWLQDGRGVILSARDVDTQLSQVWMVSYPDGKTRRITNDLASYQGLSLSPDGRIIASVQQNRLSNIWHLKAGDVSNAVKLTSEVGKDEGMSGVAWTRDGRIVYTTRANGVQDIWITDIDRKENRQLTVDSGSSFSPAVSADGRYIVFVSDRSGSPNIWRMNIDGGDPRQLTSDPGVEGEPKVTPDGQWVVYNLTDVNNKTTIWKVGLNGGVPIRIVDVESSRPAISPDGTSIACDYGESRNGVGAKLAIVPVGGGLPIQMIDAPDVLRSRVFRWSPDGRAIIYVARTNGIDDLWIQPLDGGPPKQITRFESDRIYRFDLSYKGEGFALARGSESSDVVVISDFQ